MNLDLRDQVDPLEKEVHQDHPERLAFLAALVHQDLLGKGGQVAHQALLALLEQLAQLAHLDLRVQEESVVLQDQQVLLERLDQ